MLCSANISFTIEANFLFESTRLHVCKSVLKAFVKRGKKIFFRRFLVTCTYYIDDVFFFVQEKFTSSRWLYLFIFIFILFEIKGIYTIVLLGKIKKFLNHCYIFRLHPDQSFVYALF